MHPKRLQDSEPSGNFGGIQWLTRPDHDGISGRCRRERFAQAAERHGIRMLHVIVCHNQQVDVACQLQVLKSVVQDMHRASQLRFCELACQIAPGRYDDRRTWNRTSQHEGLVARMRNVGLQRHTIADDHDIVHAALPFVTTAQDGRPLTHVDEQSSDRRHERRLAGSAHAQISDADDRACEMPVRRGV